MLLINRFLNYIHLLFFLAFATSVYGQASMNAKIELPKNQIKLSNSFSAEVGRSIIEGQAEYSSNYYLGFYWTDSKARSVNLHFTFVQELTRNDNRIQKAGSFLDPVMDLSLPIDTFPISLFEEQKMVFSGSIGSSQSSTRIAKEASLAAKYQYGIKNSLIELGQYHRITRSFYTKEVTEAGLINSPWAYRFLTNVGYQINKSFRLSAAFIYDLQRSFQDVLKDSFSTDYKINYQATEAISMYLGIGSYGMNTKAADGRTTEISLIDDIDPMPYIGIAGSF